MNNFTAFGATHNSTFTVGNCLNRLLKDNLTTGSLTDLGGSALFLEPVKERNYTDGRMRERWKERKDCLFCRLKMEVGVVGWLIEGIASN